MKVSPKELSEMWHIPMGTIRTWISKKQIPYNKVNKLIRIDVDLLEEKTLIKPLTELTTSLIID